MSDKFVTDTKDHFVVGQTVVAKVTSIDEAKQRVLLCLKLSECSIEDPAAKSISLLSQCFEEMKEVRSIMRQRGEVLAGFHSPVPTWSEHKTELLGNKTRRKCIVLFQIN